MLNLNLGELSASSSIVEPAAPRSVAPRHDAAPTMTVVFATRNRAAGLVDVLECFVRLMAPVDGWKLIVVDNGSDDGTARLLGTYARRLPLTALSEPDSGKNRSLNTALPHLEGNLIILTDDDVLPNPDWLLRLQQAALDHPEASLFGGTVLPRWSRPGRAWLTNMAVRSGVFRAGHRFSETVGPDQGRRTYAMGGETEFLRRAEAAGFVGWFAPEAIVRHIIRSEQLDESWIFKRAYRYGIGEGALRHAPHRTRGRFH